MMTTRRDTAVQLGHGRRRRHETSTHGPRGAATARGNGRSRSRSASVGHDRPRPATTGHDRSRAVTSGHERSRAVTTGHDRSRPQAREQCSPRSTARRHARLIRVVGSESAIRVGHPSRPSESAIRVGHPSGPSEATRTRDDSGTRSHVGTSSLSRGTGRSDPPISQPAKRALAHFATPFRHAVSRRRPPPTIRIAHYRPRPAAAHCAAAAQRLHPPDPRGRARARPLRRHVSPWWRRAGRPTRLRSGIPGRGGSNGSGPAAGPTGILDSDVLFQLRGGDTAAPASDSEKASMRRAPWALAAAPCPGARMPGRTARGQRRRSARNVATRQRLETCASIDGWPGRPSHRVSVALASRPPPLVLGAC